MLALSALLLCGPARADEPTPISVGATDTPCSGPAPVEEALARRGFRATAEDAPFRLEVRGSGAGVVATLVDRAGEPLLWRTLPAGSCADVADTVALLVKRRLEGVSWEAPPVEPTAPPPPEPRMPPAPRTTRPAARMPPPRPPPPRPSLDVAAGLLFATGFARDAGSAGPAAGVRFRPAEPWTAGIAVGRLRHAFAVSTGSLVIDRYPLSLHLGWSRRRRALEADVEGRFEIETLAARSRGITAVAATTRASVRAGPCVALATEIQAPVWVLLHAGVLFAVSGWELVVHDLDDPRERTSVARQVPAVELGAAAVWRFGL